MRPDELIGESVELFKNNYYSRMFKTKQLFFKSLQESKSLEEFIIGLSKIWKNLDYQFMNNQKEELERLIDKVNQANPNGVTKEFLEMINQSKFDEVLQTYKNTIQKYYASRLSTIEGVSDVDSYLSNFVEKYDAYQGSIPYFTKDGLVHSYHNIADYSSMMFNTNLLRVAINRTLFDANYLGKDLIYIPAHNFSCPKCMEWQGKVYSASGNDKRYPSLDEAYSNGLGHPNCKHIPVVYWDSSQLQSDRFDSDYWVEQYKRNQKEKAIRREISKRNNDLKIYKALNNQSKIDLTKNQIRKLRSRLSEL